MKSQLAKETKRDLLPLSVMYVEDEIVIIRAVTPMMKRKIKDVYYAINGEIGLDLFKKHRPQIVVTDIRMPIMNGLEMIEKIKKIEPATKFIVVSAYGEINYFLRAIELGVHGFILKPVDVDQLMAMIQELGSGILLQQEIIAKEEERKTAESARLTLEKQYAELHENMRDGSVRTDLKGKIQSFNVAFQKTLGYSDEELYKKSTRDITPKKWHSFETEVIETQVKTMGYSELYQKEYIHRDGRIIPIECRTYLQRDENNEMVGYWGIVRDITSRKQSEEALQEQKAYFEHLFESSPEAVVVASNDGKILQINSAFSEMFGYTEEEAVGKVLDELVSNDELLNEATEYTRQVAGGKDIQLETKRKTKSGKLLDVSILGTPIIIEGQKVALYGIYRDITDRKRAEDELKSSYERLQKLIQDTVNVLANVVELRDPYTAGHQHNVAQLGVAIAEKIGCSEDMIEGIRIGGTMHDIGKIKVPIRILNKSEMLTDKEWEQIKLHPTVGYDLLKDLDFPWQVAKMVHQHHERFDGSGYPNGLKNDDILMEARILAVADVVEAMANDRPYRQSLGLEIALEEIEDNKGILYDPDVVENAIRILKNGTFVFDKKHTDNEKKLA